MIILEGFKSSPSMQAGLVDALNLLAKLCSSASQDRGFQDDENKLRNELSASINLDWFENAVLQAEVARQVSELGEAVEAIRKPGPDHHLPAFDNFLVEEADCVIRIADTCGRRYDNFGAAVVAKILYNLSRPYKHGKNS